MQEQGPDGDATSAWSAPPTEPETGEAPIPPEVPDASGPRRVRRAPVLIAGVVALVAIAATAALGYSLDQDLAVARNRLTTTTATLDTTTGTLATTTTTLGDTTVTLAAATKEREGLDTKVIELSAQVKTQTDCAARQSTAIGELSRLSNLQTDNFNRTASKSKWEKADNAREKAITAALDAYYRAYSRAFEGSRSAARVEADKGATAMARINAEEKKMAAEQKIVDAAAADIEKALDALEAQLVALESTCQAVTR
jgi:chromosome segregation ATPase